VKEQFEEISSRKTTNRNKSDTNWNNDEIATMLDIVNENMEQVEGNFIFNHAGGDRLLPFDNHTLEIIPKRKYFCHSAILYCKGRCYKMLFAKF
jgi:hypothetical protein